jgi:hypothetical protein
LSFSFVVNLVDNRDFCSFLGGAFVTGVASADLVQGISDLHLGLRIQSLCFEFLHGVALGFFTLQSIQSFFFRLFGQLGLPPGFEVAFGAFLCFVVHVLGIGLEGDFLGAAGAFDVEAVDGDGVVLFVRRLFARVELATLVDELSAGSALLHIMLAVPVLMGFEVL